MSFWDDKIKLIALAIQPKGSEFQVFKGVIDTKNPFIYVLNPDTDEIPMTVTYRDYEISKDPDVYVDVTNFRWLDVADEIAKKEGAILRSQGGERTIANYKPIVSTKQLPEKVVKKPKPGDQPDSRFTSEILEKVKMEFAKEVPEMVSGIVEHFGSNLPEGIKNQLQQIVYSTATTSSMITIRVIAKAFEEVKES